jgi:transposase-like protein
MSEKQRTYDDECKRDAVRLATDKSDGASKTARRLRINVQLLSHWKRETETNANGASTDKGHASPGRAA